MFCKKITFYLIISLIFFIGSNNFFCITNDYTSKTNISNVIDDNFYFCISDITFATETKGYLNFLIEKELSKQNIKKGSIISSFKSLQYSNITVIEETVYNVILKETGKQFKPLLKLINEKNGNKSIEIDYKLCDSFFIKEIKIFSKNFKEKDLKNALKISEDCFFGRLFGGYIFYDSSSLIKSIKFDLKKFLNNKGFYKPKIKIQLQYFVECKNNVLVSIYVDEGLKYIIDNVFFNISHNNSVGMDFLKSSDINSLVTKLITSYLIYNTSYTNEKKIKIKEVLELFFKSYGFLDVIIFLKEDFKELNINTSYFVQLVNVSINIELNNRHLVNKIIIRGNEITQDFVIRACINQKEYEWLNYNTLLNSKDRILTNKYVTKVDIIIFKKPSNSNYVNVIFEIKELERHSIVARFSLTPNKKKVNVNMYTWLNNFFGTGLHIYTILNLQRHYDQLLIEYNDPLFFQRIENPFKLNYGLSTDMQFSYLLPSLKSFLNKFEVFEAETQKNKKLFLVLKDILKTKKKSFSFFEERYIFDLYLTKFVSTYHIFKFGLGYDTSNLNVLKERVPKHFNNYFLSFGKKNNDLAIVLASNYNSINDILFPVNGFMHTLTMRFSILSTLPNGIFKIEYNFHKFLLITKNIVFNITGTFYYSDTFSFNKNKLIFPFFRNFKITEFNSVTGFKYQFFGPVYYSTVNDKTFYIGGNIYLRLKFILYYNFKFLYTLEKYLRIGFFFDTGQFFNTTMYFIKKKNSYMPKISYGIIFRIKNPFFMGATEISFVNILNKDKQSYEILSIKIGTLYF